jgi:hypothetical protein
MEEGLLALAQNMEFRLAGVLAEMDIKWRCGRQPWALAVNFPVASQPANRGFAKENPR